MEKSTNIKISKRIRIFWNKLMNSKDIFNLKDASELLGLNINTFRYWLKKNSDDCDKGIYETKLYNLLSKVRIMGKTQNAKLTRMYDRYIILDINEFKTEFQKYSDFLVENKRRKRKHNLGWSYSAIECYENNMECTKCNYKKICLSIAKRLPDKIPPMKKTVQKLLIELGLPPKI